MSVFVVVAVFVPQQQKKTHNDLLQIAVPQLFVTVFVLFVAAVIFLQLVLLRDILQVGHSKVNRCTLVKWNLLPKLMSDK